MKRIRGFGLVEMMIAVAIMAILLALAVPGFQTFVRNAQVRSAAEAMLAGMNLARTEALRRNTRVSFWTVTDLSASCARSASGASWVISLDDPAGRCNSAVSETVAPRLIQSRSGTDGSSNVSIRALSSAAASVSCMTFNGFGGLESDCASGSDPIANVVFASPNARTLELQVTSGGAIRMCDQAASADC